MTNVYLQPISISNAEGSCEDCTTTIKGKGFIELGDHFTVEGSVFKGPILNGFRDHHNTFKGLGGKQHSTFIITSGGESIGEVTIAGVALEIALKKIGTGIRQKLEGQIQQFHKSIEG